ncbi:transmembrane protein, putative [Rhizoctonia solani AG-3 Rhs1AP]|uniref:Transmembrane protein, putative n=2 Tax=Rhizoctonia solani AG-3 TaxID=1086053 RepID=X8JWC6_9AGAM|nr:transmembrane protein, putative [Rhizoctonia solani AG-3 Rhs1AP]KEP55733.1 putative transmembrane protein [Rhizoctonia solani 123E]
MHLTGSLVFTSLLLLMRLSFLRPRPGTRTTRSRSLLSLASSLAARWSSATPGRANSWLAASCSVVTLCQRMSKLPFRLSRPSAPSSLSTGAQPVSSSVFATSPRPASLAVTLPRSPAACACCPTPPPSRLRGAVSTPSLIFSTRSVLSSTGTLVRVWRKASSPRPVKTWLPSRRTMRRLALTRRTLRRKRESTR